MSCIHQETKVKDDGKNADAYILGLWDGILMISLASVCQEKNILLWKKTPWRLKWPEYLRFVEMYIVLRPSLRHFCFWIHDFRHG